MTTSKDTPEQVFRDAHVVAIRAERPELEPMYVTLAETTKALL